MRVAPFKDRGHCLRKAVFWVAISPLLPLVFLGILGEKLRDFIDGPAFRWVDRLRKWSHPCLYRRQGETLDEYRERSGFKG